MRTVMLYVPVLPNETLSRDADTIIERAMPLVTAHKSATPCDVARVSLARPSSLESGLPALRAGRIGDRIQQRFNRG